MLENCLSGSEGGGAIALPTPINGVSAYGRARNSALEINLPGGLPPLTTDTGNCP
jgi:hypothetical protein